MSQSYDHDYPPGEWTVDEIAAALERTEEAFPIPAYGDDTWTALRNDSVTAPVVDHLVSRAEQIAEESVPAYPASLYLEYDRGKKVSQRKVMQPTLERARRLSTVALAECFERDGRFYESILDHVWALCEQPTWLHPANLSSAENVDGLPGDAPPERRNVALRPAGIAKLLGQLDYLLGDKIHPAARKRMRDAVEYRVLEPYEARDDFWWMEPPANNWNAVCNAGPVIAALYLEADIERQARLLVKGVHNLRYYLNEFDGDGCTPEGIGYWNYGFGNYAQLAAHIETRLDGAYSLCSPPIVEEIAQFPLRIELSRNRYPAFSDASERGRIDPFVACWMGKQLDLPGLAARGREELDEDSVERLPETLGNLVWSQRIPPEPSAPDPPLRSIFSGYDWWVVRTDPADDDSLAVAVKGGHNGESHNHNDCGSFVFHHRRESLFTDLGAPVYDDEFFGEKRYEYLAARSLGHTVPYVNECEQAAGRERSAESIEVVESDDREKLVLELAGCYPAEADLESLRRTFTFDRTPHPSRLVVEDRADFSDDASDTVLESVFISYFPVEKRDESNIVVRGERGRAIVTADSGSWNVEHLPDAVNKSEMDEFDEDHPDVWRARFASVDSDDPRSDVTTRFELQPEGPNR